MLQFIQVIKSYGSKKILDIPFLQLEEGLFWLKGPNGAGKSTLLRILAGILPFHGTIRLKEYSLRDNPVAYQRYIGWADAEPLYPGFLSGKDLLAFYQGVRPCPPGQVDQLIQSLGVQSFLSTPAATWSSGMTKKISLLLAFLGRPSLLLLDEPLVTLDPSTTLQFYSLIRKWQEAYGSSVLISSHQELPATELISMKTIELANSSIELI